MRIDRSGSDGAGSVHGAVAPVRRLRVLMAHPGAELYGSDRVMLESVSALVDAGHDVTVALPTEGPLNCEVRARGAQTVRVAMPVLRKSALRPRGASTLLVDLVRGLAPSWRLLRHAGRDRVYVSTLTIPGWLLLGRLFRRRVVCHVHEAEASASRPIRVAMAAPLRCADVVLVNSEFSRDVLLDAAPALRSRAAVVYNAVPGPATAVPPRMAPDGEVRLLFLGRLSPRKGPDVALAALAELVRRGVDARLDLLGDVFIGYEWFGRQLREQAARDGLTGRVRFVGFEPDVWPRLAASDIVLVPSVVDEPFGNTAVEAVLAARPLIVSSTSGLREAAQGYRSAQSVVPGDAVAIADAVEQVLARWTEFAALAETDRTEARQRHDAAQYRAQIVAALA